ncbi:CBS domain-containing protein [Marinomonas sp. MED121]|uniref:CBS domain-containing protein n=1 Tax=Marinomonas sp. MED121 TaxID=314277 RepID=UPI0002E7904F|nr:CBS domain-containing protein [Marinomonas sp. MED121]
MKNVPISQVMKKSPVCVEMDTRLEEVRRLLEEHGFHHLPVLDGDELVGIISDRDILRLVSPFLDTAGEMERDLEVLNKAAHQVMTRQPICVSLDDSLNTVIDWMTKVSISCIPVLDNGQLVGIITWRDLVSLLTFED